MKKYITILCLVLLTAFSAQAASKKDSTDFKGHWTIQVQGGISHTTGETTFGKLISPAATLSFGYQFTPVWGLRAGLSGWQGKGAIVYPRDTYKFTYLQGNVDVMVDIVSIFDGYRAKRLFNPYLFAGIGVAGGLNNDEAAVAGDGMLKTDENSLLWDNLITPVGRFGLGLDIRLCNSVYFNLEVNADMLSDRFNSKQGSELDWQLHALAGLTFKIEKAKESQPAPAQYTPTPAPEPEPAPAPEPEPEPVVEEPVVEYVAVPSEEITDNIYFLIGKSVIRESEKAKIEGLVDVINKDSHNTVIVTGYADEETGTAERNMVLSKERAENVAQALIDAGISADRIKVEYKGSTVNPYEKPEQNRVAICVVTCYTMQEVVK